MKRQNIRCIFLAFLVLFSFMFLLPGQPAFAQDPPPLFPAAYLPALFNQVTPSAPVLEPVTGAEDGSYTLSWSASTYGEPTGYIVQEAANPGFTQLVQDACNTPDLSCEITGKAAGTVYYRVRGINEYGSGTWSSTQSAAVLPPGTPALSGINNLDFDRSYTLNWTSASLADMYRLQQSSDNAFTSPTDIYTGTDKTFSINDQVNGAYYYRVRAEGPTGASAWSVTRSVAILPPPAPVLSGINNSDFDRIYTLTWQSAARASSYTLEQSTDSAFTSPSVMYTGMDTTFPINNQVNGAYYYRVRAVNPIGAGPWSSVQSIAVLPPSAPVLNTIYNSDYDRNYTVSWQNAQRTVSYILEQSTNSAFTVRTTVYNGEGTTWSISPQVIGTHYYRVRAVNPVGASGWSAVQTVTIGLPSQSTLNPISNSDGDGSYTVSWTAGTMAASYTLEESITFDFTNPVVVYSGPKLTWNKTSQSSAIYYHYRVRSENPVGSGTWSEVQSVAVAVKPQTPVLSAIDNTDKNNFYKLSWSAVGSGITYVVEEANNSAFSGSRTVYKGSSTTWLAADQPYHTFYYRVKATISGIESAWSSTQSANVPTPPAGVTVLNNHSFLNSKFYSKCVIGEIYNNTGNNILFKKIGAKFYNKGVLVATSAIDMGNKLVQRYEKAFFSIPIDFSIAWDSYQFEPPVYSTTSTTRPKLTVYNTSKFIHSDRISTSGEIRNDDIVNARYVNAYGIMFNENGKILYIDSSYPSMDTLAPGASCSFNMQSLYLNPSEIVYIRYQAVGSRE